MTDSESKQIAQRIAEMPPGAVFISADFLDIAGTDNVSAVLSRMAKSGSIVRVVRGVYCKPRHSDMLDMDILPSPDEVAHAIARSNKWIIAPSGNTALNMLGLDEQVPATYEYVSSGPYKTYRYGKFTIALSHRANRDLLECSELTCLMIQALKALGKGGADSTVAEKLKKRLTEEEILTFYNETKNATTWVFEFAKKLKEMKGC